MQITDRNFLWSPLFQCFIFLKTYKFLDILHYFMYGVKYKHNKTPLLNLKTKGAKDR